MWKNKISIVVVTNTTKKWLRSKSSSIICTLQVFIMDYKAPHVNVDAYHFVQIQILQLFNKGLSTIKLHPIHLRGFLTYLGENLCPRASRKKWFNLSYLRGKCANCGFHILPFFNKEIEIQSMIIWWLGDVSKRFL